MRVASALLLALLVGGRAGAQIDARAIYLARCYWCHGEQGRGDGPAATGMIPPPRDFVAADYKIRSTPHGRLPTDDDLFRTISKGLPGTPMSGWEQVLSAAERRALVDYLRSLSPRFATEPREPIVVPTGPASAAAGEKVFRQARCALCHGEAGRADGPITTTLNFQWGLPFSARDFTRGWTFKGGRTPADIYRRITGGVNGTPMGPYRDLLTDQERWDLAHYVASLDEEPSETSEDFLVVSTWIAGEIPAAPDAPAWGRAAPIQVPLAGQIVLPPPRRWWTPTAGTVAVRSLWNAREVGFLLEWNDPTAPAGTFPDAALLQFAARPGEKPYFMFGDPEHAVRVWQWQSGGRLETWTARGAEDIHPQPPDFQAQGGWTAGRWHVVFRRSLAGEPRFAPGQFVATLFSVRDGANAESGNTRALSTWVYTTLEEPPSLQPWLAGAVALLGMVLVQLWVLARLKA